MSQRIDLAGLKESIDELVRLTSVLREARAEFMNTAEASAKVKEELNKGTSNFKQYQQQTERIVEVNAKVTSSSKTVLETEKEKRKTYEELNKSIKEAMEVVRDHTATLGANVRRINELREENKKYAESIKLLKGTSKGTSDVIAGYTAQIQKNRIAINDLNRTTRNQIKEMNASEGSINQMRAQLNQLTQVYDDLNKAEREGEIGKTTRQAMADLSNELKILEGETGRFQRNVGNYPAQMGEVSASIKTGFKDILSGNLHKGLAGVRSGINGVVVAGRALIATPIGVVFLAIAGAVAILTVQFKAIQTAMNRSEKSSDKLSTALAPFKGIVEMLINLFAKFGEILIDVVVANLELAGKAFEYFANIVNVGARALGLNFIADGVELIKNSIDEATEAGLRMSNLETELRNKRRENVTEVARLNAELEEQREITSDTNVSIEDRLKANAEIYDIQKKINEEKRKELALELSIIAERMRQGDNSTELLDERAKIVAQLIELNKEESQINRRTNRERNRLISQANREERERLKKIEDERKRAEAERKRIAEEQRREEIAMNQALLDNFILTNEKRVKFDENFLSDQLDNYKKFLEDRNRLEIENLELQAGTTYEEALAKSAENRTSTEQRLINDVIRLNKAKDEELKRLDEEHTKYQEDLAKRTHESLKKDMATRLAYAIANGEDLKEVERDYYNELYKLDLERFEELTNLSELEILNKIETNEILTDLEREYADAIIAQRQRIADWKKEDNEEEKERELEKQNYILSGITRAIGYEQELRQVQADYNAMMRAMELEDEQAYEESRLQLIGSVANTMASIVGKETVFGKALAVAQIAIDTATAVMRVTAQAPLLAPYLVPTIIALGTAQAVKISTTKIPEPPKFAKGVEDSTYEGLAIVDEVGAELHFDKKGNLKSFGEDYGARFTYVERGDTIIPAHKSKALMEGMPGLTNSLLLNGLIKAKGNNKGIEKRLDEIKSALTDKENKSYLDLNDNFIIEVTERNGSTYQRLVKKIGHKNVKQTRLW